MKAELIVRLQGFIHPEPIEEPTYLRPSEDPLPSLSTKSLTLSPLEVIHAFSQPFSRLIDQSNIRPHAFRGSAPYYAVDVTEEAEAANIEWAPTTDIDEVGDSDRPGRLEIWGLTGWYLNLLMKRLGLYE